MQTQTYNPSGSDPDYKPPVILQVLPELRSGGVERGTIEIARAIAEAGGVSLVASAGGPMASQVALAGAEHITMPLDSKNPLVMLRNVDRLVSLVKKRGINIIHARSRAPAWSACSAAKRARCHFMTTFHGGYGLENNWKRKYNSIMTRGERVIAISHFIAEHIMSNYKMDEKHLRIIHRGVDVNLFNPEANYPQRMIELTRTWRLPELPLILFPGRLTRWKGQDVFIRALGRLPHRNFFAVLLGDDKGHEHYRAELERLIVKCGLEGHVRIAGHTSHIVEAYKLARLVVATSIDPEPFGRVVLEAQAMGRPVIATNQGGPQETVIHGVSGWLVKPGDVTELSDAIAQMLVLSDEQMRHIAVQGRESAMRFSLEMMCERTLDVYKELLD